MLKSTTMCRLLRHLCMHAQKLMFDVIISGCFHRTLDAYQIMQHPLEDKEFMRDQKILQRNVGRMTGPKQVWKDTLTNASSSSRYASNTRHSTVAGESSKKFSNITSSNSRPCAQLRPVICLTLVSA